MFIRCRPPRSPLRHVLRGLLLSAALCFLWAAGARSRAQEEPDDSVEVFESLVEELVDLQLETGREEARWREEQDRLETTLTILSKEKGVLEEEVASLEAELQTIREQDEGLEKRLRDANAVALEIDAAVRTQAQRLLAVHDSLPEPLASPLEVPERGLRQALDSEVASVSDVERLRRVIAFATQLQEVLEGAHAVQEVLDLGPLGRVEASVIYLGCVLGYYVTPDEGHSGLRVRTGSGWESRPRDGDLAGRLRRARALILQEESADLVDLPIEVGGSP